MSPTGQARATLARAYARMTPDEIAAHGVTLAEALEMSHATLLKLKPLIEVEAKRIDTLNAAIHLVHVKLCQAQNLAKLHRKAEARDMLAELSARPIVTSPGMSSAEIDQIFPSASLLEPIFNPYPERKVHE